MDPCDNCRMVLVNRESMLSHWLQTSYHLRLMRILDLMFLATCVNCITIKHKGTGLEYYKMT